MQTQQPNSKLENVDPGEGSRKQTDSVVTRP